MSYLIGVLGFWGFGVLGFWDRSSHCDCRKVKGGIAKPVSVEAHHHDHRGDGEQHEAE